MFFDFGPLITLILAFYFAASLSLLAVSSLALFGLVRALLRFRKPGALRGPRRTTASVFRPHPSAFRRRKPA